jgi:RNA-directed DNA polymerase
MQRRSENMGERISSKAVFSFQCRLAIHADHVKDHVFHNLYSLLCRREWLEEALNAVLDNAGSKTTGVDEVNLTDLRDTDRRAAFLDKIQKELKARGYHPFPVLRKWIPKRKKGARRPIGIPTIKDRVVQMLLKMVLEPIFECDFLCNSNGFRPNRSTLECVLPIYHYGKMQTKYDWIIEGDIEGCFDNIDHEILMKSIQKRIGDKRILRLVWRFLKAPIKEYNMKGLNKPQRGTPQGAILSPLLANIYLNEFDQYWFKVWGNLSYIKRRKQLQGGQANCVQYRYADDFILCAKGTRKQVEGVMNTIRGFFSDRLNLKLSADKTRVVSMEEGFDFLGFRISRERLAGFKCIRIRPTQGNVIRLKTKLQMMLGKYSGKDDPQIKIAELNQVLRGWAHYFSKVNSGNQFSTIDYYAKQLFLQWYSRRPGRRKRLGIKCSISESRINGRTAIEREDNRAELFRMSDLPSQHISMNFREIWKYRSIPNPYLKTGNSRYSTSAITEPEDSVDETIRNTHPLDEAYGEIYRVNRIRAFKRDGWRCVICTTKCMKLVAHHIEPVPRNGTIFDPNVVHRVDNLLTLCADCHNKLPKTKSR